MKTRMLALLTALLCLFALSSCAQPTPYELITDAGEQLSAANGYEINATVNMSTTIGGEDMLVTVDMDMKSNGDNYAMDLAVHLSEETNDMEFGVVYADGVAYVTGGDTKSRFTLTAEQLEEELGVSASFELPTLTEEQLSDVKLVKEGDSSTFTVTLSGEEVNQFMENMGAVTSMTGMVCPSPFPKSSVVPGRAQPPLSVRSTLLRSLCRMNAAAAHSSSSAAPSESGSTAQSLSSSAQTR